MIDPKTGLTLIDGAPNLNEAKPSDIIPPVDRGDLTSLDEDHLRRYIISAFQNCITDKYDYNWLEKKEYAIKSYYGLKNEAMKHWPHEGASAFPVPMTPTLLDTAWANVQSGIWANSDSPIMVPGVGTEDIRPANILLKFLNWQVTSDMNFESESDKNVFRTFLHGTGILKIMFDIKSGKVKIFSIDLENFYVPIDSSGVQKDGTDIVTHIIPLSYADVQVRKAMNVYRDPDALVPGMSAIYRDSDQLRKLMDEVSGVSMDTKVRRDNYYIAEVDLSNYMPRNSLRPLELKVWMSPNGAVIQRIRKIENGKDQEMRRPYAVAHAYPYPDRFYSMGMPEKLRNIQEKLDYSDKQYTDALDIANLPAMFVDDTDSFNRTRQQRVRGGIYPKGKGNTIDWEPQPPIERGFAQERAMLWEQGERLTGVIDITQGRASSFGGKTLGEIEIRSARADVRFSTIFKRFEKQFRDAVQNIYELDDIYFPENKFMDVVGYQSEGYTMNEIFPKKNGKLEDYNFRFSGYLQSDKNVENEKKYGFLTAQMTSRLVDSDPSNIWRVSKEMAEISGVKNFGEIVSRPKETRIIGVDEFIQRVISGEKNIQIRPGIDADDYVFEIQLFMRSQTFQNLEPFQQKLLVDALRRAYVMGVAERKAQATVQMMMQGFANEKAIAGQNIDPESTGVGIQ